MADARVRRLAGYAGLLGGTWLALRIALHSSPPPLGIIVYGGILGILYALVAFGLILVYKATRIINFAQAQIGASAGVLAALLIAVNHVGYFPALAIAISSGAASGLLVEWLVVRRFRRAPRLVLSVATIGVGLLFSAVQLILPFIFGVESAGGTSAGGKGAAHLDTKPPTTPFSHLHFRISYTTFDSNFIVIVVAGVAVLAALTAFLRFSDAGLAVRAAAENSDRATLLGIPISRLSAIVWAIAGALSALGMFLRIPVTGIPLGSFVGPGVLLSALAAAVIAKMERFDTALIAAIAIGIVQQSVYFSTHDADVPLAVMLPVLLMAMLLQRGKLSRGQDTGTATWQLAKDFRLAPPELRGLPELIWGRRAAAIAAIAGLGLVPLVAGIRQEELATVVLIYGIVVVSLVVLTGWSGQISLGQWGLSGVGAAVAGGVATHLSGDFFVAVGAAGLAGAAAAVVIGLPALRIQGLYLAVTTLALAMAVEVFLLNTRYFAWLLPGQDRIGRPVLFRRFDTSNPTTYYGVVAIFLVLALLSARALRQSRAGRILLAVRDNQRGAQAYGISVHQARLWAFAISGFWAAVAGALFAYDQGAIDSQSFAPEVSITLLMVAVIGGSTSLPGAMLGMAYFGFVKYSDMAVRFQLLATGFGALVLLLVLPGGLAQMYYGGRDLLLRRVAARRDVVVPSLVADVRVGAEVSAAT